MAVEIDPPQAALYCSAVAERSMGIAALVWNNTEVSQAQRALEELWDTAVDLNRGLSTSSAALYDLLPTDEEGGPLSAIGGAIACVAVIRPLIEVGALIQGRSSPENAANGASSAGRDLAESLARSDLGPSAPRNRGDAKARLEDQTNHAFVIRESKWQDQDREVLLSAKTSTAKTRLRHVNEERANLLHRDATRLGWI